MGNNIWSELRKNELKKPSVWDDLKKEPPKPVIRSDRNAEPIKADNQLPPGTISFDIETASVDEMWKSDPSFLRLMGYGIGDSVFVTEKAEELVDLLRHGDGWIISHNGMNFDLIILEKYAGLNILELAKANRLIDTKLLAFLADPPFSRTKEGEIEKRYSLENTGQRYLGTGKLGNLKELGKKYGGFDKIPTDDQEYVDYLKRDVEVTRDLAKVLPINDYAIREHKIAAIAATIFLQGFRVDVDLLQERIREGENKRAQILDSLVAYGLPGQETTKSPHRTNVGIQAIDTAFRDLGVELPRTAKAGRPALGKEILQGVIDSTESEEVSDLAEAVLGLNGIRTIYGNIQDNLIGDRVHPSINLRQSSGRWSIQRPGLTVLGKRGGKVRERAVFLPDEGEVLISCDLAQVDARAVGALSQDLEYLKLFEPGRDLHSEMAQKLGLGNDRERAKAACVPLNYEILTKDGWKTWDQVSPGVDETLGLGDDGLLHWTPILVINKYEAEEVINLSTTSRFNVVCTPNHRWITDWRRGYNDGRPHYYTRTEREAQDIHSDDNLVLSAPADTGKGLPISNEEAELIGWVLGDGSLKWVELKPSRSQGQNGERRSVLMSIYQSKPTWMADLDQLTTTVEGNWSKTGPRYVSGFGGKFGEYTFRLASLDARDFVSRAFGQLSDEAGSKNDLDLIQFVLSLNPTQREAFLDGFWKAEGHLERGKMKVYSQTPGPILDAVELAVFLTGKFPSRTPHEGAASVRGTASRVTGQRMKKIPAGSMDVWCPTTGLGSWVLRNGHQIILSGNSHGINYGMRAEKLALSVGMSQYEAESVIHNFDNSFRVLVEWQRRVRIEGETTGVLYNGFGRLMRIEPNRAFTQAPALLGQSTARDILCEGLLRLWNIGGEEIIRRIKGVIHDEAVLSVPIKDVTEIEQLVVKALSFEWCPEGGQYPVSIIADVGSRGINWSQCYNK